MTSVRNKEGAGVNLMNLKNTISEDTAPNMKKKTPLVNLYYKIQMQCTRTNIVSLCPTQH